MRYAAESAVERTVTRAVRRHHVEADPEERTAAGLDRRVVERDRNQETARATNEPRAGQREALDAATDRDRAVRARGPRP